MRAVLHPLEAMAPEVVAAWSELAERAAEPNPFSEPLMVLPAVRHLGEPGIPALLAVHHGDSLVAAAPLVHRSAWRRIPWPTWATFRHDYCYSGTPLVDRDHLTEAAAALWAASGLLGGSLLALEWLRLDGPVVAALRRAARRGARPGPSPIVYEAFERPATRPGDEPLLPGSKRRRFRRAAARIAGPGAPVPEPRERPADPAAVAAFLDLEAAGWKGGEGTAFACRPGHGEFLVEMVAGYRRAGRIRLVSMESAGRPVAMTWSLRADGTEFGFKTTYDEVWKPAAPGIQVVVAAIEAAAGAGAAVDSCSSPDERWLSGLMPDRVPIGTLVLAPPGAAGLAVAAAVRALVATRDRRNARRSGSDKVS